MKQNRKFGLVLNEDEWSKEWSGLLKLSSYQPRTTTKQQLSSSNGNLQFKETNESSKNQKISSTSSSR
jgi:hypothetical protein